VASSSDGTKLVAITAFPDLGGYIYTSTDTGATWTQRTTTLQVWNAVASSSDGRKLVALVNQDYIYTSVDSGATWTRTDAPSKQWFSVASSSDGARLIAAAYNDYIYRSTTRCELTHWAPAILAVVGVVGGRHEACRRDRQLHLHLDRSGAMTSPVMTATTLASEGRIYAPCAWC